MRQYIVDAFTDKLFHGNQAAICILHKWIPDDLMMNIAKENNFSETAFAVPEGRSWHLRWFTPGGEINLCGHATLACAYILFKKYIPQETNVIFTTLSGELKVKKKGEFLEMEFPAYDLKPVSITDDIISALGKRPNEAYLGRDLLFIFDNEEIIKNLSPDLKKLLALDGQGIHITSPGNNTDCVSRSFFPKLGVAEDPVCGSGHCHIIPYWSQKLHKQEFIAYQASRRGGTLHCRMDGKKVYLAGQAVLFSESILNV